MGAGGSHKPWENCGRRHTFPAFTRQSRWRQATVGEQGAFLGNYVTLCILRCPAVL